MRYRVLLAVLFLASGFAASVSACIMMTPFRSDAVRGADIVVVGRITNYTIVQDPNVGFLRRLDARLRYGVKMFPGDYARFDITVDEILAGKAPRRLSATWPSGNFGPGDRLPTGPYLVALRKSSSQAQPGQPGKAHAAKAPGSETLSVIQGSCSPAMVYPEKSPEAKAIKAFLSGKPQTSSQITGAVWAIPPSEAQANALYPLQARLDEIEGVVTIECVATTSGLVERCRSLSERPAGYGFAEATAKWVQNSARLKAGTYTPGEMVRISRSWRLN